MILALVVVGATLGRQLWDAKSDVHRILSWCGATRYCKSFSLIPHRYFRMRFC
jgi:hypothetical protein